MNKRIINLILFIKKLEKTIKGDIILNVYNIETKKEGIAFYSDIHKEFRVYEGSEDGSDDKDYSIYDFEKKYEVISINIEPAGEIETELE